MKINVRLIYLYLFSLIGLLIVVIGTVRMVDLGLKVFVFKDADKFDYSAPQPVDGGKGFDEKDAQARAEREQDRSRQRETSGSVAMILVGLPLYLYHWKTIQRENKKDNT